MKILKKWDDLKVFLQYGSITDEKFYDRIKDIFLLKNIENQYFTIEEYKQKSRFTKDKNDTLIYLYSSDTQAQHLYIEAKEKVRCFIIGRILIPILLIC